MVLRGVYVGGARSEWASYDANNECSIKEWGLEKAMDAKHAGVFVSWCARVGGWW